MVETYDEPSHPTNRTARAFLARGDVPHETVAVRFK
jgi:hypothetical protein